MVDATSELLMPIMASCPQRDLGYPCQLVWETEGSSKSHPFIPLGFTFVIYWPVFLNADVILIQHWQFCMKVGFANMLCAELSAAT